MAAHEVQNIDIQKSLYDELSEVGPKALDDGAWAGSLTVKDDGMSIKKRERFPSRYKKERAPFTNGYVVYVIHEEAYNLPNATRSLLIVLSRKGYHAVYKSLYTKVYSLYNTMCGFKKNINRNWQRIKAYLECMFLLPMQGRKKINSFTALAENTTVKENVPVLTVLKTDCVKYPVLRKSFRDTATLLKAKLTESRTKLKHSLNCDMKHLNQSLKRKDAIISKLKTQRRLLRKENLILRKKINSDDIKNINKMQQMELSLKEITADYMQLMQDKDRQIIALQQQISDLQCQLDSFKVKDLKCDLVLKSKTKKQYNTPMRKCIYTCLLNHVPVQRTGHVIETVVKELTQMRLDEIPGPTTIAQMAYEISVISDLQVAEQLYEASEAVATLSWDSTTIDGCHINEFHISINGESLTLNINKLSSGRTEDYFEHIKNTIQDLAETYSTFSNIHQHLIMYKFREAFNTTLSDRARVNHCINSCLSELLGKELVELKCNLHPLDGLASEARKVLKKIDEEKSIISNIHGTEGCAANLVYRISKLRYSDKCGDPGGLKTYLKEHGLKIGIIPRYVGNRFNILFHMAGVIYQMKDILCSFLDKYCTANIRLHIKEDLEKPEILTQLRVLGLFGKLLTGPWMTFVYSNESKIQHLDIIPFFRTCIQALELIKVNPEVLVSTTSDCFLGKLKMDYILMALRVVEIDTFFKTIASQLAEGFISVLHRQLDPYLTGTLSSMSPDLQALTSSAPLHNMHSERTLGMYDSLKHSSPNASTGFIAGKIKSKVNNTMEWLANQDQEKQENIVLFAVVKGRIYRENCRLKNEYISKKTRKYRIELSQKREKAKRRLVEKNVRAYLNKQESQDLFDSLTSEMKELCLSVINKNLALKGTKILHIWEDDGHDITFEGTITGYTKNEVTVTYKEEFDETFITLVEFVTDCVMGYIRLI